MAGAHRAGKAQSPIAPGSKPQRDRTLPLPNERDESLDAVDQGRIPVIHQAKKDLDAGQVDTDMRATPGLDAERRHKLLKQGR